MYAGMGYRDAGGLQEFSCEAGTEPIPFRTVGPEEFAVLRRRLLPEYSVIQEGRGLAFLAEQLQFFAGNDFLLAAYTENGVLQGLEYLGEKAAAPGLTKALGCTRGSFRTSGTEKSFAMFHPLTDVSITPAYFGFAFD